MAHPLIAKRPGQSIVMFAVLISAIMAMLALGTDLLVMYVERRAAQGAADLAALSGAPLSMSGSPSPAATQARATATANGYTNGTGGVVVQITYPASSQMRIRITKDVPTIFARFIGWSTTTVLGQATAAQNPPPPNMAIYGRNAGNNNPNTVDLTGGGGSVTINGSVYSYCDLRAGNNYTINAAIWVNGSDPSCGVVDNTTTAYYSVGPKDYPIVSPITDLTNYPCDYDLKGALTSTSIPGLGRKPYANELPNTGPAASRHDGEFDIGSAPKAWWQNSNTLQPGVYCVRDGNLKWTGSPSCPCSGNVTFVLAGNVSKVQSFSPSDFTLTPFRSNMMIFNKDNGSNQAVSIGGSGGSWGGYIYAPATGATVTLTGSGTRSLTGAVYADFVNITGGAWTLTGTGPVPTGIFISGLTE